MLRTSVLLLVSLCALAQTPDKKTIAGPGTSARVIQLSDEDSARLEATFANPDKARAEFDRLAGDVINLHFTRSQAHGVEQSEWSDGCDFSDDFRFLVLRKNNVVVNLYSGETKDLRRANELRKSYEERQAIIKQIEHSYLSRCEFQVIGTDGKVQCWPAAERKPGWENYAFSPDYRFLVAK